MLYSNLSCPKINLKKWKTNNILKINWIPSVLFRSVQFRDNFPILPLFAKSNQMAMEVFVITSASANAKHPPTHRHFTVYPFFTSFISTIHFHSRKTRWLILLEMGELFLYKYESENAELWWEISFSPIYLLFFRSRKNFGNDYGWHCPAAVSLR